MAISPVPSVMISGCTRADADADAVHQPRSGSRGTSAISDRTRGPIDRRLRRHTKALTVAAVPADRSIPPVSIVSVWQAASIASGMAKLIVLPTQRWFRMPGLHHLQNRDQQRPAARSAAPADSPASAALTAAPPALRGIAHRRRPLIARTPPSITTATMIVPSMMVVTFGSTDRASGPCRTSRSTKTAMIGPEKPAPPAAQNHAAQHHRRDGGEQIGPRDRRADPRAHGQRQGPPMAANSPASA